MLQIQHYMAITNFKAAYIAVLIGGNQFIYKRIVIESIFQNVEWMDNILNSWKYKELKQISSYIGRGKSLVYVENSNYKIINQACIIGKA